MSTGRDPLTTKNQNAADPEEPKYGQASAKLAEIVQDLNQETQVEKLRARLMAAANWLRGFLFGMTMYEQVMYFRRQRADLEHLFVLISFGDLLGVPILPPYYTLRLLPYIVPLIGNWRNRMLREKDLTDLAGGMG